MEKAKAEILSEMYAVRSVLSIVSQNEDEVQYITNNEINPLKLMINNFDFFYKTKTEEVERQHTYAFEINKRQNEINEIKRYIEGTEDDLNDQKKRLRSARSWYILGRIGWSFVGLLAVAIPVDIILFVVFYLLLGSVLNVLQQWQQWVITYVVWCAAALIYSKHKTKERREDIKFGRERIEELKNRIANYQDDISNKENEIAQLQNNIDRGDVYTQEGKNLLEEIKLNEQKKPSLLLNIHNSEKKISEIKANSKQIIEKARETYRLIDFRDWRNVDLVIFYFETGRAETIKEALYQVDRERQSENIVKAIGYATSEICKSINSSIAAIADSLNSSFKRLITAINNQNEKTRSALARQAEKVSEQMQRQNEETNRLLQNQISEQKMNNAILQKINISSDRLADDMERQLRAQGIQYYS